MENAIDALKMAFAVLIFLVALAMTFSSISQVKETANIVFHYNDKTEFYDKLQLNDSIEERLVKIDTIISTLYKVSKESIAVRIIIDENNPNENFDFDLQTKSLTQIENDINTFKKKYLSKEDLYKESFSEVVLSGTYETADGDTLTIVPGDKKLYITYKKI